MPLRSAINQYTGPNAHFLSHCQEEGNGKRWEGFHDNYIVQIQDSLGKTLLPYGYVVDNTTSLQVRRVDENAGPDDAPKQLRRHEGDVAVIYDPRFESQDVLNRSSGVYDGALALSIEQTFDMNTDNYYRALALREINDTGGLGEITAWIEILSPSNKPGGRYAQEYMDKRLNLIKAGLPLIEIDLLHRQEPMIVGVPDYRDSEGANPYLVTVTALRLDVKTGGNSYIYYIYGFGVDTPFPVVDIPLRGERVVGFDFGIPFDRAFSMPANYLEVDYQKQPGAFGTYQPRDQAAIENRMRIVELHRDELDKGPFLAATTT